MRETNLICRRIPNNLCRCPVLKEKGCDSPSLQYGMHIATFFQGVPDGRGQTGTVVKPDSNHLSQVIKVNINSDRSCRDCALYVCDESDT